MDETQRSPASLAGQLAYMFGFGPNPSSPEKPAPITDLEALDNNTKGVSSKFVDNVNKAAKNRHPAMPVATPAPAVTPIQVAPQSTPGSAIAPAQQGQETSDNPLLNDAANVTKSGIFDKNGNKYTDQDKNGGSSGSKTDKLVGPEEVAQIQSALEKFPAYQNQMQGLQDLKNKVNLNSWRRSQQFNPDLSGIGGLADLLNAQQGHPTNLEQSLKPTITPDTSVADLGEIQRRENDATKDAINLVRYGKTGQIMNSNNWMNSNGFQIGGQNPLMAQRIDDREFENWRTASQKLLDASDTQKAASDQMTRIAAENNPADIPRLLIQRLKADTGGSRLPVQEVLMEKYGQDLGAKIERYWNTLFSGNLSPRDLSDLRQSMLSSRDNWAQDRENRIARIGDMAHAYRIDPTRAEQTFPPEYLHNAYTRPNPAAQTFLKTGATTVANPNASTASQARPSTSTTSQAQPSTSTVPTLSPEMQKEYEEWKKANNR